MQYIDLVNTVLQESGKEMDDLTPSNWGTVGVGQRLYPRVKRYVAESWKKIQIELDEWEFKAKEFIGTV